MKGTQNRHDFEAFVYQNLGDVAVMDNGRYISSKINNYWRLWEESRERYSAKPPAAQPAVPDAFGTREGEHPQYVQGWNDCRAEMLKGMK
jgi:hypothetical protein